MNQSALVGGALLAGFVLFLAARNRLGAYGAVLFGSAPQPAAASDAKSSKPSNWFPDLGDIFPSLPQLPSIPDLGHMGF